MTLPAWRDWLFSIKTFAAAMLAVYIGLLTSLPRPYWAMATVYICSQPLSGATRSKGMFRVGGTLIGAVAAIVMVPALANAPVLLSGALILWVGGCLYLSLLDRTPRSYTFMLGGYTAALIGFPAVTDPAGIWDLALARTEEIVLGITCASLVSSLIFPRSVGDAVAVRIAAWLGDGARLTRDALTGARDSEQTRQDLLRLAGDAAELDILATHLAYDTSDMRDAAATVHALRLRMLMLLPMLSAIADRLAALRATACGLSAEWQAILDRLVAWIRSGPLPSDAAERRRDADEAEALRSALARVTPQLHAHADWSAILTASLAARLREFIAMVEDCRVLRRRVAEGRGSTETLRLDPEAGIAPSRHRDGSLALLSSLGVGLAMALCCAFWIESGWPDGSAAPMMAAVAACFFAAQDDPVPSILQFANYTGVAVVVIAVYTFAIFPQIHDFEVLVLALAPFLLVTGTLISMPKTMGKGLAIAANGSTILALQGTYAGDFQGYVNSNLALLAGMYAAAVVMRLVRSVGAEWAVRRIIRHGRHTIAAAAATRDPGNRGRFAGLMLDRVGLLAPRVAALEPDHPLRLRDVLAHIRTGLNVIDLRRARSGLPSEADDAVKALLKAVATTYRSGFDSPVGPVLPRIDAALSALLVLPVGETRNQALMAVVGIRRGLLPGAPAYRQDGAVALEQAA